MKRTFIAATVLLALLTGCSTPPRTAAPKTYDAGGERLTFDGTYQVSKTELELRINGDPVLKGRFPPFTPTLNLNGKYKKYDVRAECYFSSALSSKSGLVGIIGGAIQSSRGKTSDKCEMIINGKRAETLYF